MDLDLQHDEFHPAKCCSNFEQIDQNNWHTLTNVFYTRVHDEFHILSFTVTVIITIVITIDSQTTELQWVFLHVCRQCAKELGKDIAIITLSKCLITRDYQLCISYNKLVVSLWMFHQYQNKFKIKIWNRTLIANCPLFNST